MSANLPTGWRKRTLTAAELDDEHCDCCGMSLESGAALNSDLMIFYCDEDDETRTCSKRCARDVVEYRAKRAATS